MRDARVDYDISCGNISAAVGVYAVEHGLVRPAGRRAVVAIHNLNTARIFYAEVPVADGHALVEGGCRVDGVPGQGAEILLDMRDTVGTVTSGLLPTGSPVDTVVVAGLGPVEVSIVDIAYLCFAVRAADLGLEPGAIPVSASAASRRSAPRWATPSSTARTIWARPVPRVRPSSAPRAP